MAMWHLLELPGCHEPVDDNGQQDCDGTGDQAQAIFPACSARGQVTRHALAPP